MATLQWQLEPLKQILKRGLKPIRPGDASSASQNPKLKLQPRPKPRPIRYGVLPAVEKREKPAAFDVSMSANIIQRSSPEPDFANALSPIAVAPANGASKVVDEHNDDTSTRSRQEHDDGGGNNESPNSHALSDESIVPSPPEASKSLNLHHALLSEAESKHNVLEVPVEEAKGEEETSYSSDWSINQTESDDVNDKVLPVVEEVKENEEKSSYLSALSVNQTESDDVPPPPPPPLPPPREDESYSSEGDFESLSSSSDSD